MLPAGSYPFRPSTAFPVGSSLLVVKNVTKIKIQDNSGDREYFTIVPNYILNHSTSTDQSLYLQMKRYAGEDGECFATQETIMNKLGIGIKAYRKSLNYLVIKKWIEFVGLTGGKTRPIKTYRINNIWQENSDFYKKIPAESTLSKDTSQKEGDTSQKHTKIPAESTIEEDPVLRRTNEEDIAKQASQVAEVIKLFEVVNPACKKMYGNTTQRNACQDLIDTYGVDRVLKVISQTLPRTNKMTAQFFPNISTPLQLYDKWSKLEDAIVAFKSKKLTTNKIAFQ